LTYLVNNGETISDVVINATGSLTNWSSFLDLNGFDDWTPTLVAGETLEAPVVSDTLTQSILNNNRIVNTSVANVNTLIDNFIVLLNEANYSLVFASPSATPNTTNTYIVEQGETIGDVCFNATGTLDNWSVICDANNFQDWNVTLYGGQAIVIPDDVDLQLNVMKALNNNHLVNSSVPNLNYLISQFLINFESYWILTTGFWDDLGIWQDSNIWID